MKLNNGKRITKNKNDEKLPPLEITELVLVHYSVVNNDRNNNDYEQDTRVLHGFVPNKSFGQLMDTSPHI